MFLGLRTVIYPVADAAAAKAWWSDVLGTDPYFDEAFYVGFDVGGYELGLLPSPEPSAAVTYWGVRCRRRRGRSLVATVRPSGIP